VSGDLLRRVLDLVGAPPPPGTVIVSGPVGCGKTAAVTQLAADLVGRGVRVGGFVAPRRLQGCVTIGYDVTDLATGITARLASIVPPGEPAGRFYLARAGLRLAHAAVMCAAAEADVVILDEIGPAELAGGGHVAALRLVLASATPAVLVVRDRLVAGVTEAFGLTRAVVVAADQA
jgi:nucleoside-triphosphatase